MQILNNFRVTNDNKITLNKYQVVLRRYTALDKSEFEDDIRYLTEEEAHELEVNVVPKHQLLEIISKAELDNAQYSYMEGITLRTQDFNSEITEIASYGSKEAYEASLPEYMDDFMLDMECRMAMVEMGIQ